jgi:hypothetical protein
VPPRTNVGIRNPKIRLLYSADVTLLPRPRPHFFHFSTLTLNLKMMMRNVVGRMLGRMMGRP